MPAFAEEIEAALQEGIRLETLVAPVGILSEAGSLSGIECIKNELGEVDVSGRRRPVPIPGTQHTIPLDTLIVAISEGSDTDCVSVAGANRIEVDEKKGTVRVDPETLCTNRPGVFAGGDVVTGPNTVVEAIAAGKKAAIIIERYLLHEPLRQPAQPRLPRHYIPPPTNGQDGQTRKRVEMPRVSAPSRRRSFAEVEMALSVDEARYEARRCLRCDLEFTQPKNDKIRVQAIEEQPA
jgi:NADH-quinone oxidoreductase subunit F